MKNKVFLGGTCAESTWRDTISKEIRIDFFNPVVKNWTEECQAQEELEKREKCNIHLYVITSEMIGVYSLVEAMSSANKPDKMTILHIIPDGFENQQLYSLKASVNMLRKYGAIAFIDSDLLRTSRIINNCFKD